MSNKELKITLKVDAKTGSVTAVRNSFDELDRKVDKTKKGLGSLKGQFLALAGVGAIIYGISKAFSMAADATVDFTKTAAEFEQYKTTLSTIQGSSQAAATSMEWIGDFTAKTPYEIGQVTESFVKMKAYGLDPMDGTLKSLGNASSAMGKPIIQAVEAMADAVTGENERLKEFGIKASQQGEKVAYAWADSSGKSRNIVVNNNKDIIQSTLNAIFNEKYAGAMDAQSRTWNGIISNMQDKWTQFKVELMDAGLFTYFKAIAMVASDLLGSALDVAESGAKSFTDSAVGGIQWVIGAVGDLYDMWSGVSLVWAVLKTGFFSLVEYIGKGINALAAGWDMFTTIAQNTFKSFIDTIGQGWVDMINFVLVNLNRLISSVASLGNKALEFFGLEGIEPLKLDLKSYTSSIDEAKRSSEDLINLDWSKSNAAAAAKEASALLSDVVNESGATKAANIIAQIDTSVQKLTISEKSNNKEKQTAAKLLEDMGAKYGDLGSSAEKSSKRAGAAAKKAAKDAQDALDKTQDAADKLANRFSDSFSSSFSSMLNGDLWGSFESFFDGVSDDLMQPLIDNMSSKLSSTLSSLTSDLGSMGSFASGLLLKVGGAILSSFLNTVEEKSGFEAQVGMSSVQSESIVKSLDKLENTASPQLEVTKKMAGYLKNMSSSFDKMAVSIGNSSFADGSSFKPVNETGGFLGFSSKQTELDESGVAFSAATTQAYIDGAVAAQFYQTTQTQESSWWGLSSSTTYNTEFEDAGAAFNQEVANATQNMVDAITLASDQLGFDTSLVEQAVLSAEIDIGKLNLEGASEEEIAKLISSAFSGAMDSVILEVMPGFEEWQQAGEGYAETVIRVATATEQAKYALMRYGIQMVSLDAVTDKSGDALTALIKDSVNMSTKISQSAKEVMMGFDGTGVEAIEFYDTLVSLERSMRITGYSAAGVTQDMLGFAGSLANLSDMMNSYVTNILSESQQLAYHQQNIAASFADIGMAVPSSKADYQNQMNQAQAMALSADKAIAEHGAFLVVELARLSELYNEAYGGYEESASSALSVSDSIGCAADSASSIEQSFELIDTELRSLTDDILSDLSSHIITYMDAIIALDDELAAGSFSLNDATALIATATIDNYSEIFSALQRAKTSEIAAIKETNQVKLDALNEEKKLLTSIYGALDKIATAAENIRSTTLEDTGYAESEYGKMYSLITLSLRNGKDISDYVSDYTKYAADYAKSLADSASSSQEATWERLRLAYEMDSVGDAWSGATLDDVEDRIEATNANLEKQTKLIETAYTASVGMLRSMVELQYRSYLATTKDFYALYLGDGSPVIGELQTLFDSSEEVSLFGKYTTNLLESTNQVSDEIAQRITELGNTEGLNLALQERIRAAQERIELRSAAAADLAHGDAVRNMALLVDSFDKLVYTVRDSQAGVACAINGMSSCVTGAIKENTAATITTAQSISSAVANAGSAQITAAHIFQRGTTLNANGTVTRQYAQFFAQGGIVTAPTNAVIGEAGYAEAVVPLKNPNDPLGNEALRAEVRALTTKVELMVAHLYEINKTGKKQLKNDKKTTLLLNEDAS